MDELDKAPINHKPGERWLTRGGRIARLYADDGTEPFVLHGAVGDKDGWTADTWTRDGGAGRFPASDLDLIRRYDWREELAPIWAVLKPEYRWIAMDRNVLWEAYMAVPERCSDDCYRSTDGVWVRLNAFVMPTPGCPWYETLTERPEGA